MDVKLEWNMIFEAMSWIYSLAWTLSFYGQICENRRLRNVEGMNFNFAAINLNGFLLYALYNLYGYFVDQKQTGLVTEADLFFALHALGATLYTAIQACIYPSGNNQLDKSAKMLIGAQWLFLGAYALLINLQLVEPGYDWGLISCMGYMKLMCSGIKYIPQLLWNYERKTTHGWSVFNVLMDLTGGIFSVAEIFLRMFIEPDYVLNITKLLLGALTIVYDLLFVHQHYCLYPSVFSNKQKVPTNFIDSPSQFTIQKIDT